jgi:hypothetical protein
MEQSIVLVKADLGVRAVFARLLSRELCIRCNVCCRAGFSDVVIRRMEKSKPHLILQVMYSQISLKSLIIPQQLKTLKELH